jgi:hypothetical protein
MTHEELTKAEQLARRVGCANCWTGTTGSLAAATMQLIREHQEREDMHASPAEALLTTAIETIRQRRGTYGPPREHFARTVAAINAVFAAKLAAPLTVSDWAQIMILDKLARHQGTARSADTPVDLAGYAACLAECEAVVSVGNPQPAGPVVEKPSARE